MKSLLLYLFSTLFLISNAFGKPNILFIAIDDLNDWLGCMDTHPQVRSPVMDKLAAQGVLFTEAHCAAPVCGPSRTAIMSGLRPYTTGVYSNNANYPKRLPDTESMPQYLRRHGYYTLGAGKLFHGDTNWPEGSFDEYAKSGSGPFGKDHLSTNLQNPSYTFEIDGKTFTTPLNGMPPDRTWGTSHTFDWGPVDLPDGAFKDTQSADWIIDKLGKRFEKPFFMSMGFHLPHQPMFAPKRFHDMYPVDKVQLPPHIPNDLDDLSEAGRDYALIPTTSGTHRTVAAFDQWNNAVSSYLATITFVDHLLGRIMKALEASPHADNTWIFLWSDHGWHLGEKEHWGKATGWFRATRVPLMIIPPAKAKPDGFKPGSKSHRPVNLIDLFPTVCDVAELTVPGELEGLSLLPLIKKPDLAWSDHTITTFGRGNHAITTNRWRYIQYFDGTAELYDRQSDPNEWKNLIHEKRHGELIAMLKSYVPEEPQFKHFIRYKRFKAVVPSDGSHMLLYNHQYQNNLEERFDESPDHPKIVAAIQAWLDKNKPTEKRLIIPDK
jgi:arylsulfatase A-like enzyme